MGGCGMVVLHDAGRRKRGENKGSGLGSLSASFRDIALSLFHFFFRRRANEDVVPPAQAGCAGAHAAAAGAPSHSAARRRARAQRMSSPLSTRVPFSPPLSCAGRQVGVRRRERPALPRRGRGSRPQAGVPVLRPERPRHRGHPPLQRRARRVGGEEKQPLFLFRRRPSVRPSRSLLFLTLSFFFFSLLSPHNHNAGRPRRDCHRRRLHRRGQPVRGRADERHGALSRAPDL